MEVLYTFDGNHIVLTKLLQSKPLYLFTIFKPLFLFQVETARSSLK